MVNKSAAGLAGVIAGQSAIATVGQEEEGLHYRGYSIDDLAEYATFEEVAYLLHYGRLPSRAELNSYIDKLVNLRHLPSTLKTVLKLIPKNTHPMDVLRTGCSMLGTLEPEENFSQQYDIADRLLALLPGMMCYWYAYHHQDREISGESNEHTVGGHFLTLLHDREPTEIERHMMNVSLILYAEHEFNASTFAARVTAATLADFYSAVTTAIGTLRGPLHGGANEAAMELLERFKSPDEAERILMDMLAGKEKSWDLAIVCTKNAIPVLISLKNGRVNLPKRSMICCCFKYLNVLKQSCDGRRSCSQILISIALLLTTMQVSQPIYLLQSLSCQE